ncbi:hypothetical protein EYF80_040943 [Liparis tanakae]|uniref:Uncharacterized protein n=1 Tax=Liparis tanakae TaxID=230148 RepID=A0A4Z2G5K7_9TELE|nr:hypothetical protein EYF80_040943 [Liparis tanakae]
MQILQQSLRPLTLRLERNARHLPVNVLRFRNKLLQLLHLLPYLGLHDLHKPQINQEDHHINRLQRRLFALKQGRNLSDSLVETLHMLFLGRNLILEACRGRWSVLESNRRRLGKYGECIGGPALYLCSQLDDAIPQSQAAVKVLQGPTQLPTHALKPPQQLCEGVTLLLPLLSPPPRRPPPLWSDSHQGFPTGRVHLVCAAAQRGIPPDDFPALPTHVFCRNFPVKAVCSSSLCDFISSSPPSLSRISMGFNSWICSLAIGNNVFASSSASAACRDNDVTTSRHVTVTPSVVRVIPAAFKAPSALSDCFTAACQRCVSRSRSASFGGLSGSWCASRFGVWALTSLTVARKRSRAWTAD